MRVGADTNSLDGILGVMDASRFQVIDCDALKGWNVADRAEAIRFAAWVHARTGHVVEVVHRGAQLLVLPPDAPFAKAS